MSALNIINTDRYRFLRAFFQCSQSLGIESRYTSNYTTYTILQVLFPWFGCPMTGIISWCLREKRSTSTTWITETSWPMVLLTRRGSNMTFLGFHSNFAVSCFIPRILFNLWCLKLSFHIHRTVGTDQSSDSNV